MFGILSLSTFFKGAVYELEGLGRTCGLDAILVVKVLFKPSRAACCSNWLPFLCNKFDFLSMFAVGVILVTACGMLIISGLIAAYKLCL